MEAPHATTRKHVEAPHATTRGILPSVQQKHTINDNYNTRGGPSVRMRVCVFSN